MYCFRYFLAFAAAVLLPGQTSDLFSKAPPDVDAALRARVTEFYTLHKASKFRAVEKMVCEDSKDAYYDSMKTAYKKFEIIRINYEPDFKSAKVVTNLEAEFTTQQGNFTSMMPLATVWKVEDGTWCYHIPPAPKVVQTPFGVSKKSDESANSVALGTAAAVAADPKRLLKQIQEQVKVSRTKMTLKCCEDSSDEMSIQNGTPGPLELSISTYDLPGLKLNLSAKTLPPGATGVIKLDYHPTDKNPKPAYDFLISMQPVNKEVRVKVVFDLSEEMKKTVPKDLVKQ
jgi:hypothetical protein